MPIWGLGSVLIAIFALVIAIQPRTWELLVWLYRKFCAWNNTDSTQCQKLRWSDIRNDLHRHWPGPPSPCLHCSQSPWQHFSVRSCWKRTVLPVFNNLHSKRSPVKKPESLPLAVSFLQTEPRVVLAYLIATVRCNDFDPASYLQVQEQEDHIICHLKGPDRILDLTKIELDRILDGWPPFYREHFKSPEGHPLESPMVRYEQMKRPGWIMAVGLGLIQPADICRNLQSFDLPLTRVQNILKETFLQVWPNDADVLTTMDRISAMQEKGSVKYPSGFERASIASRDTIQYPENIPWLSKEQCEVAMQVFSSMSVSIDQKTILEVNLKGILFRLCLGFAAVLDYSSVLNGKRQLIIPELLKVERPIYLRDCYTADELHH